MSLLRTMLRPVAAVAGLSASRQGAQFLRAHGDTPALQDRLLGRLISAARGSDFARDHNLDCVGGYADLVKAVPVGDYETHRPYVQRVLEGDSRALFAPGTRVLMFAVTSGTTGSPKHIPVTRQFLADYRRGWNVFGIGVLKDHPQAWLRKIVTIASSCRESVSPAGLPCGAISGMLAQTQKWIVRRMYPAPPQARELHDAASKYYLILRASIGQDVGFLTTANPSSAIRLAEIGCQYAESLIRDVRDGTVSPPAPLPAEGAKALRYRPDPRTASRLEAILQRHGQLLPRQYWNLSFLSMWTGGTLGLYLPRVRQYYGEAPIRDIGLLASEGRLSVPLEDGTPAGVAEVTSNFLEFMPAEQAESAAPDVLRAHQVEVGREYLVLLSNFSGLWRYNINDRVRVTGFLGQTPIIAFLSKAQHTSSITGEKLTEHQVIQAMTAACRFCRAEIETFTLQGHFAARPYYQLNLELADGLDARLLAARLDEALRGLNVEYDQKRSSDRLGPIRPHALPPGSFARHEAEQVKLRGGRGEQYKHKYLLTEVVNDEAGGTGSP